MNCEVYAIDTESVGVGPEKVSALARVSIVNYQGKIVLDLFCKPSQPVSKITDRGLKNGKMFFIIFVHSFLR